MKFLFILLFILTMVLQMTFIDAGDTKLYLRSTSRSKYIWNNKGSQNLLNVM
jgi:hypothetical protein